MGPCALCKSEARDRAPSPKRYGSLGRLLLRVNSLPAGRDSAGRSGSTPLAFSSRYTVLGEYSRKILAWELVVDVQTPSVAEAIQEAVEVTGRTKAPSGT